MKTAAVKKLKPLDRLLYFIREREAVRLKKEAGKPAPWTDDEILQRYRFCNVRRMDDKVSRWLLDNWYTPYKDHPNMLAAVCLARFFNQPAALNEITDRVFRDGGTCWDSIKSKLRLRKASGKTVFNGAYIVRADAKGRPDKIADVIDGYVRPLVDDQLRIDTGSMRQTWGRLCSRHGYGSFMAGQVVADLRWALSGTWTDRNEWAPVGPGSARGLARLLYEDEWVSVAKGYTADADEWLYDFNPMLETLRKKLPKAVSGRLEAHDYQNCFCEWDKHERALWQEGSPKQKYPGEG